MSIFFDAVCILRSLIGNGKYPHLVEPFGRESRRRPDRRAILSSPAYGCIRFPWGRRFPRCTAAVCVSAQPSRRLLRVPAWRPLSPGPDTGASHDVEGTPGIPHRPVIHWMSSTCFRSYLHLCDEGPIDFNYTTDGYEGDGPEDVKSQDGSETMPFIDESPTMSPQLCTPHGDAASPSPPEGLLPGLLT
ncbi:Active breakpoint cluster region-related protein [Merluccius polli]|uniref:Active breakpoint cluster region-related protein n=1 Tax=Merluccius polli TaxID=89951 RepID=A0AA47NS33_MERPO|nr:Active breakpoint cluster region-related protein [Merluccius polli]